jgi:ribosome-associated protein
MPEAEKQLPDEFSKTQRKKDMLALQELGRVLTTLSDTQLDKLPISEDLMALIKTAKTLKTHESKRRHMQYIGKKMRQIDVDELKKAIHNVQLGNAEKVKAFHDVEEWRDQLIAKGDEGLQKFLEAHPETDRQHLRTLIRKAQHDVKTEKNTGGALELFRYLREVMGKAD